MNNFAWSNVSDYWILSVICEYIVGFLFRDARLFKMKYKHHIEQK